VNSSLDPEFVLFGDMVLILCMMLIAAGMSSFLARLVVWSLVCTVVGFLILVDNRLRNVAS
jgi:hypothetical protein